MDYVVFKTASYAAIYEPWDGVVHVDINDWGPLYNGGGKQFFPALSDVRAISAVPEPSAAVVFATGTWLLAVSIRRLRAE